MIAGRRLELTATIPAALMSVSVLGHHSRAHYDATITEIRGTIVSVSWTNPHVGFELNVSDGAGETQSWRLESWSSPYILSRMGVDETDFTVGSEVTVAGMISRSRSNDLLLTHMLRADGTEIVLAPNQNAFFGALQLGGDQQWIEDEKRLSDTETSNLGLFRVWSVDRIYRQRKHEPLTAAAIAGRESWNELDSFIVTCEQRGMPQIMSAPYPIEFIDEGDRLVLRGQYYDFRRTIDMTSASVSADVAPTRLGRSFGYFEGDTLVVETTNIDWDVYDLLGTPQSDALRTTEHFTLSADQSSLRYRMTIVDPYTFTEPAVWEWTWLALGETVEPFDCTPG